MTGKAAAFRKSFRMFCAWLLTACFLLSCGAACAEGEAAAAKETDPVTGYPVITFGQWQIDLDLAEGGSDPIEWLVLENDGKKALLLSREILQVTALHQLTMKDTKGKVWAQSSLRKWLNGDFFKNAFTKDEQKAVLASSLKNPPGPQTTTKGGNSKDKLFLLSYEELEKYLPTQESRKANRTAFASVLMQNQGYTVEDGVQPETWWLRTPGFNVAMALLVEKDGSVDLKKGEHSVQPRGVRPALWVDVKKMPVLQ